MDYGKAGPLSLAAPHPATAVTQFGVLKMQNTAKRCRDGAEAGIKSSTSKALPLAGLNNYSKAVSRAGEGMGLRGWQGVAGANNAHADTWLWPLPQHAPSPIHINAPPPLPAPAPARDKRPPT